MDVIEAIETRRAIKFYDPEHRMTEEEVHRLLDLACLSPTAFNMQNWRFVVVDDPELRRRIRAVSWDQPQVTDASLLLVMCADLRAWEKEPERYWRHAPADIRELLVNGMLDYYRGKHQVQRDEAMRSCGIAAQTLMLAALGMGYGSCPLDGFDFDAVAELIRLPDDHIISLMITVGKPAQPAFPRSGPLAREAVVVRNHFE